MRARNLRLGVSERADVDPPWAWTAGHRAIIEAMLRKDGGVVGRFLLRMGLAASEIDPGMVRVFVEAHRRGAIPPAGATSASWLAAIALDVLDDPAKGSARGTGAARAAGSPPESIAEFLQMLEPEARAVFVLFEIDRETSRSIAAAFGFRVEDVHECIVQGQRTFRRAHHDVEAPAAAGPAMNALPEVG